MGASESGARLTQLLTDDPRYRAVWERYSVRMGGRVAVSEAAVCRVLAAYLWDMGERPESDTSLPRRLRDLVSRALHGRVLTRRTVHWFSEAFEMRPSDREELLRLLSDPSPSDSQANLHEDRSGRSRITVNLPVPQGITADQVKLRLAVTIFAGEAIIGMHTPTVVACPSAATSTGLCCGAAGGEQDQVGLGHESRCEGVFHEAGTTR